MKKKKKRFPFYQENFSRWYTEVITKADLADYAPVRGCMVFKPYGFSLWENVQQELDRMIKSLGVKNAYFPLFIPYSFLKREKKHVKGFSPELAIVSFGGGKKLKEPLVVRPTSETIIYEMFSRWIHSYRDLPFLINQWCNVVRWEKRTYLFLRTTEFLWQEGHTAHATEKEAKTFALKALKIYQQLDEKILAIPVIGGKKSESEKFAGGQETYTLEALMPDGKALQCNTSHFLGQNFSRVFDISFQNKRGEKEYVWQTCWGTSTRILGALIMTHGDEDGLIFPPRIAPIQVVIVPIFEKGITKEIFSFAEKIFQELKKEGIRIVFDKRKEYTPGWKFNDWELKGIPLRIEIGKKERMKKTLTLRRRDTNKRIEIRAREAKKEIPLILERIQKFLHRRAKKRVKENTFFPKNYREFREIMREKRGLLWAFWCGNPKCERKIKEQTKATTRLLPFNARKEKGKCIFCSQPANYRWLFAQAY